MDYVNRRCPGTTLRLCADSIESSWAPLRRAAAARRRLPPRAHVAYSHKPRCFIRRRNAAAFPAQLDRTPRPRWRPTSAQRWIGVAAQAGADPMRSGVRRTAARWRAAGCRVACLLPGTTMVAVRVRQTDAHAPHGIGPTGLPILTQCHTPPLRPQLLTVHTAPSFPILHPAWYRFSPNLPLVLNVFSRR